MQSAFDLANLDNPTFLRQHDPDGMLDRIHELPQQVRDAWRNVQSLELPASFREARNVIVLGMGGSAIGGDLARGLALRSSPIPITVWRDYGLPAFVDRQTLVIVSSYSGGTEETLSGMREALDRGAQVIAITTGGQVKELAKNHVALTFDYRAQPRAALGHSFIPVVGIFHRLGLLGNGTLPIDDAIAELEQLGREIDESVPAERNPAKQLAGKLVGKIPVVYGAEILADVARRWKTQINENSKVTAFFEVLPELHHNAVVGFPYPQDLRDHAYFVLLESPALYERVKLRYRITRQLLEREGLKYDVIEGRGGSELSQVLTSILMGDYVSYYLAMLYEVDPSPVEVINYLKGELARA